MPPPPLIDISPLRGIADSFILEIKKESPKRVILSAKPTKYTQNRDYIRGTNNGHFRDFAAFFSGKIAMYIEKRKLAERERRLSPKCILARKKKRRHALF